MTALADLETAREAAWKAYDEAARALPDCEHVRAWLEHLQAAAKAHQAAIRACDKARHEGEQ